MEEIRAIGPADVDPAARVLARAFADNPGYLALLRTLTDAERHHALVHLKRGLVNAAIRHQVAEGVWRDGELVGVALSCSPGQYPASLRAMVWQTMGCFAAGMRGLVNLLRFDAWTAQHHPRDPHEYLYVLGVSPEHQGRGYGGVMLRHLNARADARDLPCYLETDTYANVRLYERFGYRVIREATVPTVSMPLWMMQRPPRAAAAA